MEWLSIPAPETNPSEPRLRRNLLTYNMMKLAGYRVVRTEPNGPDERWVAFERPE